MKIEKLKKMKNGKYKIYFTNGKELITYDDVILKYNLLFHKELSDKTLEELKKESDYFSIYNQMVKKISTKFRSEFEIQKELEKKNLSLKEQSSILKKLKQAGLLNDQTFAKAYVSDRIYLSSDGPYKIQRELENQKIKEEWITEAMDSIDESIIYEKCKKLVLKKVKANKKYSNYLLKQKLMHEFVNNGYSMELFLRVFEECSFDNENVIEKETERLYKRLSNRYEGGELRSKMKEKLFQKGFPIAEINHILEEKGLLE